MILQDSMESVHPHPKLIFQKNVFAFSRMAQRGLIRNYEHNLEHRIGFVKYLVFGLSFCVLFAYSSFADTIHSFHRIFHFDHVLSVF